jgi:hypothetical protein
MTPAHEDRWVRAERNLGRAILNTGMTARIHDIEGHHCSVTFERNGQLFTKRKVDIATFDDEPSPRLERLVEGAKIKLGLV